MADPHRLLSQVRDRAVQHVRGTRGVSGLAVMRSSRTSGVVVVVVEGGGEV